MANKVLIGLVAIAFLFLIFVWFVGFAPVFSTLLISVGILGMAKYFGIGKNIFPVERKNSLMVGGGALLLGFLMVAGIISGIDFAIPGVPASIGIPAGTIGPSTQGPVDSGSCWASVSEELRGKSSTPTLNAWDMQSNTPYLAAVDVNPTYVYLDGSLLTSTTDTSAYASITNGVIGKVMDFYPAGSTYYGEPVSVCVNSEGFGVDLPVHTITTDAGMDVTCTDDTNAAALSGAGNTTQSDYDITMGADEETTFYCKWKENTANKAFRFGAIAIGYQEGTADTIDGVSVVGIEKIDDKGGADSDVAGRSFSKQSIPKFIQNYGIQLAGGQYNVNASDGYEDYWELNKPILLEEWESINVQFNVESGGSDPSADTDAAPSTKTAFYLYGIDSTLTRDSSNGGMVLSTHTMDASENGVGLQELLDSPVGSTLGVAIELI